DDADASFLIRWSDSDPDDDASISLYYDTDDAGRCGVLIVDAIRENDGADQYTWDLSMLPEGEYWVYAVIDDGANAPVVDYGAGPLTVHHPFQLTASTYLGGLVTAPGPGVFSYSAGAVVPLRAAPEPGFMFIKWEGDVSTIADVYAADTTITMNGNYTVRARFDNDQEAVIQLHEPDGVEDVASTSFLICWDVNVLGVHANIDLYYDTDNEGQDGVLIKAHLGENSSAKCYAWDVSALPEGAYWVYAVVKVNGHILEVDYSDGPLTVSHSSPFSTIWSGNPYYRMSLWVLEANIDGVDLDVDDQIAVFDGSDCVGLGVVNAPISNQNPLLIHCSRDDGTGSGFTPGHAVTFKIWDASEREKIEIITPQYLDISTGGSISPPLFGELMDYGVELYGWSAALHYTLSYVGHPYDGMNFWFSGLEGVDLSAGDEIGIFDGDLCVGRGVVTGSISILSYLIVHTSGDDGTNNGFKIGHPISLRIWLADERREIIDITPEYYSLADTSPIHNQLFEPLEDVMAYLHVNDSRPAFEFASTDSFDVAPGQTCTIRWTDDVQDGNPDIFLFYDTDKVAWNGMLPINTAAVSEDEEPDMHTWDISDVPDGAYYICAVIDDGRSHPPMVYSAEPVTIGSDIPDICIDPLGMCVSCPGGAACLDTIQAGVDHAEVDGDPHSRVVVGPGDYGENITISAGVVVVIQEGTVVLGPVKR
ncbi:MAG: hypothetical protein GY859_13865, partial [Desulfobacterales bacterium]|nr:hypothetical protein [Desulfobacterales bacterium]